MNCCQAFLLWRTHLLRYGAGVVVRPLSTRLFWSLPNLYFNSLTPISHLTCRTKTSYSAIAASERGTLKKLLKKFGWFGFSKSKLKRSGYYLYEEIADGVDYMSFFKAFELEDTFFSWYLITELHVWMLLVRVMAEGDEGRCLRNNVVEALWSDVGKRAKLLGASNPSALRKQQQELFEQFQAAIIGYDEGILSDDKVLAGAVWRRFFNCQCDDPEKVESIVMYIRKQVQSLDELSWDQLNNNPSIKWTPLEPIK